MILTTEGNISYNRYVLRPEDTESANKLMELEGAKAIVPLDILLGIADLPFKISVPMMLEMLSLKAKLESNQWDSTVVPMVSRRMKQLSFLQ